MIQHINQISMELKNKGQALVELPKCLCQDFGEDQPYRKVRCLSLLKRGGK